MNWYIPAGIMSAIFIGFLVRMNSSAQKDIIETSELDIMRILSLCFMFGWIVFLAMFTVLAVKDIFGKFSLIEVLVSSTGIVLIGSIAFSFFRFERKYGEMSSEEDLPNDGDWKRIKLIVEQVSSELGISVPTMKCSKQLAVPIVCGKWNSPFTLVLPSNLFVIISSSISAADCQSEEAREFLLRYMISHELAHIKHKDVIIKSVMGTIIRNTGILVLPAFVLSLFLLKSDEGILPTIGILSFLFTISYCAFYACWIFVSRYGEELADARAMLCARSYKPLSTIDIRSLIDVLLLQMKIRQKIIRDKERNLFGWIPGVYPKAGDRSKDIQQYRYVGEIRAAPMFWPATLLGVWSALMGMAQSLFTRFADFVFNIGDSPIVEIPAKLVFDMIPLLYFILFSLPLKNSISQARQDFYYFARNSGIKTLITYVSFMSIWIVTILHTMAHEYFTNDLDFFSYVKATLDLTVVLFAFYAMGWGFILLESIVIAKNDIISKRLAKQKVYIVSSMVTIVFLIVAFLLPDLNITRLVIILLSVFLWLSSGFFFLLRLKVYVDRYHYFLSIHGLSIINIDCFKSRLPNAVAGMVMGFASGAVLILPAAVMLYPVEWLMKNSTSVHIAIFLPIPLFIYALFASRQTDIYSIYYKVCVMERLLKIRDHVSFHQKSGKQLRRMRQKPGGYRESMGMFPVIYSSFPSVVATYAGVEALLRISGELDQESIDWVLDRQNKEGGFSVIQDATPELESTFFAVQILDEAKQIKKVKFLDKHIKFILGHWQEDMVGFASSGTKRPTLKSTYQAIASLKTLGAESEIINKRQACADWLFAEWMKTENRGRLNFEETYNLVFCLTYLDCFIGIKRDTILKHWLPLHRVAISNLRPDTNYDRIYYYIKLLDVLDFHEADTAVQGISVALKKKYG